MTNLRLSPSTPSWITDEITHLKKHLPDREVDNNFNMMVENKQYRLQFFLTLYTNIKQWGVQSFFWEKKLELEDNKEATRKQRCILKSIQHIAFTNLKTLFIQSSGIVSIQPLTWISMDSLKVLMVVDNEITSLKPLAKCSFPQLAHINLSQNPCPKHQLCHLSRTKLNTSSTQKKGFLCMYEYEEDRQKQVLVIDLSPFVKYQIQGLKKIMYVQNYHQKVAKRIIQRFNNQSILQC